MQSAVWAQPKWMELDPGYPKILNDHQGKRMIWNFFGFYTQLKAAAPKRFQLLWSSDFYVVEVRIAKAENHDGGAMMVVAAPSN